MSGKILLIGILLFLLGIYFRYDIKNRESVATRLDKSDTKHGIVDGPPLCSWEATLPERVMAENKTQAVTINTKNETDTTCETSLFLRAPGFDISPAKDEQNISLETGKSGSISWIITPRKVGSYEIALTDNLNTKVFGVSVNNMFGFTAVQAKILSSLGTLFGPMLTIPWWWERLRRRKPEESTR